MLLMYLIEEDMTNNECVDYILRLCNYDEEILNHVNNDDTTLIMVTAQTSEWDYVEYLIGLKNINLNNVNNADKTLLSYITNEDIVTFKDMPNIKEFLHGRGVK